MVLGPELAPVLAPVEVLVPELVQVRVLALVSVPDLVGEFFE
jgi:hypothetical protein